jgi:tetratricopeptide (TPR) repeat protein
VNELSIADRHHIDAAEGWIMLGNAREARLELGGVSPEAQMHPEALRVWYGLAAMEGLWSEAHTLAERLVKLQPASTDAWVWRAYALRRMPQGGLKQAWKALLPALEQFPREWIFPYNLSCYACQLGRLDEARAYYFKALSLGGTEVRRMAMEDDDMLPLRSEISDSPNAD